MSEQKDYVGIVFFVGVSCLLSFSSEKFWQSLTAQLGLCIAVVAVLFGETIWAWIKARF